MLRNDDKQLIQMKNIFNPQLLYVTGRKSVSIGIGDLKE
jgi:hypothetical protein